MSADPRALAWRILCRVEYSGAFADALLGRALGEAELERRDQALASRLVYGTLTWRGFLDLAIETFAGRPVTAIDAPIRILLEMALYQIFQLQRIPPYAAVDAAVELAKQHCRREASGFVNAVLRRAVREGLAAVQLPDPARDLAGYLSARYSHPRWLVELWIDELGWEETEALLRANNEPAPTVVRVNRLRGARDACVNELKEAGWDVEATRLSPVGISVGDGSVYGSAAFVEGRVTPQAEGSQLVSLLLAPERGEWVLDACAGSGGKSTHLAELTDDAGVVVALDRRPAGFGHLRRECARLGLGSVHPAVGDAGRPPFRCPSNLARILVDAPCSGLGTLREHPEIRWRRRPEDLQRFSRIQRRILAEALALLRPGGWAVYATCTVAHAENEQVVEAVLGGGGSARVVDARTVLPACSHDAVDANGVLRTLPHRHGTGGFFGALLKRL